MKLDPSNNINLFGYSKTFLYLINLYNKDLLPNKIIFSGNKGIGKSTFAYHLLNYIFSINEDNKYNCNENMISKKNYSYNLVLKNIHPNFFLITSNEDNKNIQVSKIREMISFTNKSSFNNECKIILIDNIECMTASSVNSLLKLIEEPNPNIYFFLIHNSKEKILDTLKSRCIKFNLFLNENYKTKVVDKLLNNDFLATLNSDFNNIYSTPGDLILLHNFFFDNEINPDVSIDIFLKLVIDKSLYKKSSYIKANLSYFIELYFNKKINYLSSKANIYNLYKYFLSKISNCNKYNLDIESILIEFNRKVLNE